MNMKTIADITLEVTEAIFDIDDLITIFDDIGDGSELSEDQIEVIRISLRRIKHENNQTKQHDD